MKADQTQASLLRSLVRGHRRILYTLVLTAMAVPLWIGGSWLLDRGPAAVPPGRTDSTAPSAPAVPEALASDADGAAEEGEMGDPGSSDGSDSESASRVVFDLGSLGDAEPRFTGGAAAGDVADADRPVVLRPPSTTLTIRAPGGRARLYQVSPQDWPAYRAYLDGLRADPSTEPPWEALTDAAVHPLRPLDLDHTMLDLDQTMIDVAPALTDGLGHVVVDIRHVAGATPAVRWVQATRLALNVASDLTQLDATVLDAATGVPISGAEVSLGAGSAPAVTDDIGGAALAVPAEPLSNAAYLTARLGADTALVPLEAPAADSQQGSVAWFVFDDHAVHVPGGQMSVGGWLRPIDWAKGGTTLDADAGIGELEYEVTASNGEPLGAGNVEVSAAGGFDLTLEVPEDAPVGPASVTFVIPEGAPHAGSSYLHAVEVRSSAPAQALRQSSADGVYYAGETAKLEIETGVTVGGASRMIYWHVTATQQSFAPAGYEEFWFGPWAPPWKSAPGESTQASREIRGTGDSDGVGELGVALDRSVIGGPVHFAAEARRPGAARPARAHFEVHAANAHVGLRPDRWFAEPGGSFRVDAVVVNTAGEQVPGAAIAVDSRLLGPAEDAEAASSEPLEAKRLYEAARPPAAAPGQPDCRMMSGEDPASCLLSFPVAGRYLVSAAVHDAAGRRNTTQIELVVSGEETAAVQATAESVHLTPDRSRYAPNETARILVRAPYAPAVGRLSIRRSGIVSTSTFRMAERVAVVEVPITADLVPNAFVHLALAPAPSGDVFFGTSSAEPDNAAVWAEIQIGVKPVWGTLRVSALAREARVARADSNVVDVTVLDALGLPVAGAEVALWVIDEAALAASGGDGIGDPVRTFYPLRDSGVYGVRLERDGLHAATTADLAGARASLAEFPPTDPAVQTHNATEAYRPRPLAVFATGLTTGADGTAAVAILLPSDSGRYRIIAVASDGRLAFGRGDSAVTVGTE